MNNSAWISSTDLAGHWGKESFELLECIRDGLQPYLYGKPATTVPCPRMSPKQIKEWATHGIDFQNLGKSFDDSPSIFIRGRGTISLGEAWIMAYYNMGDDTIFDTGPKNAFIRFFSYGVQSEEEIKERTWAIYKMQGEPEATEDVISELQKVQFERSEVDAFASEHGLPRIPAKSTQKQIPTIIAQSVSAVQSEMNLLYAALKQIGPLEKSTESEKKQAVLKCFNGRKWKYVQHGDIEDSAVYVFNTGHEKRDFMRALLGKISTRYGWDVPLKDLEKIPPRKEDGGKRS